MGIKAGETLSFKTLLYGLMLNSGNDAANVIAQHVSGNVTKFMEEMSKYIREKGCRNTTLNNPHGLPHEEHTTTAYDMAIFACDAMRNPIFREIVKQTQFARTTTNKQPASILHQHNALVRPGKFYYPKATGIKTGYTIKGGYSLVASAEDAERKLVAVLLGCEKIEQRYKDAIALFEAGFNEKKVSRTLFSKGFDLFTYPVEGAKAPLQAYLDQDVVIEYYPSEEPTFKTSIAWLVPALPIPMGEKVGDMQVISQAGKVLSSVPVFAIRSVEGTLSHRVHLAWKKTKKGLWDNVALVMATAGIIVLATTFYYSRRLSRKKHSKSQKGK
jgi:D-alanyl-D-alanine carboxypeptidase (penicillin-binding protein 5/6)